MEPVSGPAWAMVTVMPAGAAAFGAGLRLFLLAAGGDAQREGDGEGELGGMVHRGISWWNVGDDGAGSGRRAEL